MTDTTKPLILYVPGLLPKPQAELHREALKHCLIEGVRRVDASLSESIRASDHSFDIVAWTYHFYREHRDIGLDAAAIDTVIDTPGPSDDDIREATSLRRRLTLWLYNLGDRLPFLIPHLANEKMEVHMRDLQRYCQDRDGVAEHAREMLKRPLRVANERGRPLLLLTHSMGSVIAYDALWQLTHVDREALPLDTWVTMGSPLGQQYLQQRILGHDRSGAKRYPANIRRWINLTAVGDLTAIDPRLSDDFGPMLQLGLLESIEDLSLYNSFRVDGQLNVHAEYGYLASAVTGRIISDWWRAALSSPPGSA